MSRYIDVELFKKNLGITGEFKDNFIGTDLITLNNCINNQPIADVKEVVNGEWKNNWISTDEDLNGYYDGNFQCSECFEVSEEPTDFCPNCGADMR